MKFLIVSQHCVKLNCITRVTNAELCTRMFGKKYTFVIYQVAIYTQHLLICFNVRLGGNVSKSYQVKFPIIYTYPCSFNMYPYWNYRFTSRTIEGSITPSFSCLSIASFKSARIARGIRDDLGVIRNSLFVQTSFVNISVSPDSEFTTP